MANIECNLDVGCDSFILMDRREDGTDHYFLRKVCRDLEGVVTIHDLDLDGQTEFTTEGTVLPPLPDDGDCSATVISKEMLDLSAFNSPSFGAGEQEVVHCATSFLRHYVYDCDGKIKEVYDTRTDGLTPYQGGEAVGAGAAVASLTVTPWLPGAHMPAPDDNGQNKLFQLPVASSRDAAMGAVFRLETEQPSNLPDSPDCHSNGDYVLVSTPKSALEGDDDGGPSDGGNPVSWTSDPQNQSKFTFTPEEGADQLSMIRIEFHDLDSFESIWGLTPWPAKIVDEAGNTDTFEVDEASGSIRSPAAKINLFAFYNSVPEKIEYWYHNRSETDPGCRAARITGYSVEPGPCCSGCDENVDVGCETFVLKDLREDGSEHFFLRKICKDANGEVTVDDTDLDGTTPYTPEGEILPPEADGGGVDCAATVLAREMWDLAPAGGPDGGMTQYQCATTFLRHYVYDCEGKVREVYDTEADGVTAFEAVRPVRAQGATPSFRYLEWAAKGHEEHTNKSFSLIVEEPNTLAQGKVAVESETARSRSICDTSQISFNIGGSKSNKWYDIPTNNSKITLRPDATVKQMSSLRLEFIDFDGFEGVSGLSPWPDVIVDHTGGEPLFVEDDAAADERLNNDSSVTNSFFAYQAKGAIRANGWNKVIHAYYHSIPDEIHYWYHNRGGGNACHSVQFTGYSIERGPCCDEGCIDDVAVGCETFLLKDQQQDGSEYFFLRKICTDRDGAVTVDDTELDGTTPYTPGGTVVPPEANGGDCSATVISREMYDLPIFGGPGAAGSEEAHCATPFLRHYVYDCEGKVKEAYDTSLDGAISYQASQVVGGGGSVPSVKVLEWLPGAHEAEGEDNKTFRLSAVHPNEEKVGDILLETEQPSNLPESPDCNSDGDYVMVSTPRSIPADGDDGEPSDGVTPINWTDDPQNQSKMTITPALAPDIEWSGISVEFHDLDNFESVWGLTPWPTMIADEQGNSDTFEVHQESGSIRSPAAKINLFAYYSPVPEKVEFWYHNLSETDPGCHAVRVTGYSSEEGPCCSGCDDDADVGCETFILMDEREDGSKQFFLRKICKDANGDVTVEDTELDGSTPYVPQGTVLPPEAGGADCSATVFTREMWDLAPPDELATDGATQKQCATTFLKHYVYDCEGKIKEVYNTTSDGLTAYEPVRPIDAQGPRPSVVQLPWPTEGAELHEEDNGEKKRYWFSVKNPESEEIGKVEFLTESPVDEGDPNDPERCLGQRGYVQAKAARTEVEWFENPNNQSKFTFKPDDIVKQMSMLRLDFLDLDDFESVSGLVPWPDKIVDEDGNGPLFVDNDEDAIFYATEATTETIIAYEAKGAILNKVRNANVYAYYYTVPDEIYHWYHNRGTGAACHAAQFVGYTLKEGPCCQGCEDAGDIGCETFLLLDRKPDGSDYFFLRTICKNADGTTTTEDFELDGKTPYLPGGTVLPPEAHRPDCAVSVISREMHDLSPLSKQCFPADDDQEEVVYCATPFLRHYSYGCDGQVKDVYDTKLDGVTSYTALDAVLSYGEAPSVVQIRWGSELAQPADDDNGERKKYLLPLKDPRSDAVGYVTLVSEHPAFEDQNLSEPRQDIVWFGTNESNHLEWKEDPQNGSKFTFTPDDVVKELSMLRLELHDFDDVESIWGLYPWPDYIVSAVGDEDSFEIDEESGSIRSRQANSIFHAYYQTIPDEIGFWLHAAPGSGSVRGAYVTGYILEPGPSCDSLKPEVLTSGIRSMRAGDPPFSLPEDGYDLLSVRVNSIRGASFVRIGAHEATLAEKDEVSWASQDPNAIISPITVRMLTSGDHATNVSWVQKKKWIIVECDGEDDGGPIGPCEEEQVAERLCDFDLLPAAVPLNTMNPSHRSTVLANGVIMSSDFGFWTPNNYLVLANAPSNTFSFSEPVDVDFGICTKQYSGTIFRYSENIEPYWEHPDTYIDPITNVMDDFIIWDPEARTIKISRHFHEHTGTTEMPPNDEPLPSYVLFRGTNITEFTLERVTDPDYPSGGLGLTYMEVTASMQQPFMRTTTLDCDGSVIAFVDTTLDGEPYDVKGVAGSCEGCETTEVTEELCDVVAATDELPLTEMTFDTRSVDLSNDVTVSNDLGGWRLYYYSAMMKGTPNTYRFSEPVDVDFGMTSNDMFGLEFSYSPDVEPYWVSPKEVLNDATNNIENLVTVDAATRTVKVINVHTDDVDMIPGGESETLVRFRGTGITEFRLTVLDYWLETGDYTDAGITYMDVKTSTREPFLRSNIVDCNGTVLSSTDKTLGGQPYEVTGTAVPCDEEDCPTSATTEQLCDFRFPVQVPLPRITRQDHTILLPNGVTLTNDYGIWLANIYWVSIGDELLSSTFSFSEPVDVDIGISTNVIGGAIFRYSENLELYWQYPSTWVNPDTGLLDDLIIWNPAARTVTISPYVNKHAQLPPPGNPRPFDAPLLTLLRFRGTNVTEFRFDDLLDVGGYGLTDLTVTPPAKQPFQRAGIVDCNGVAVSTTDTLNGAPYVVKGTARPCNEQVVGPADPCGTTEVHGNVCDIVGETKTPIIRKKLVDCNGAEISRAYTTLDGQPYTLNGTDGYC